MVGHHWLREERGGEGKFNHEVWGVLDRIKEFTDKVREGERGKRGGSELGEERCCSYGGNTPYAFFFACYATLQQSDWAQ